MSSCVPSEQNELVVRTGLELRLRRFDFPRTKVSTKCMFVVDDSKEYNANMCHVVNTMMKALYDSGVPSENIQSNMPYPKIYNSILDLPKEDRHKGIIVCFSESSYNGRQALYHLFGERLGLKSYQAFVDVMEKTQKNGDAIVFGEKEVMWFPGPKPEFPAEEIYKFTEIDFEVEVYGASVYKINNIPESIRAWILKTYPDTKYMNIHMVDGKDHIYEMWGWNPTPGDKCVLLKPDWKQSIKGIKKAEPTPEFPEDEINIPSDPNTKAQLAAIAESLKALTAAVAALVDKA